MDLEKVRMRCTIGDNTFKDLIGPKILLHDCDYDLADVIKKITDKLEKSELTSQDVDELDLSDITNMDIIQLYMAAMDKVTMLHEQLRYTIYSIYYKYIFSSSTTDIKYLDPIIGSFVGMIYFGLPELILSMDEGDILYRILYELVKEETYIWNKAYNDVCNEMDYLKDKVTEKYTSDNVPDDMRIMTLLNSTPLWKQSYEEKFNEYCKIRDCIMEGDSNVINKEE